MRRYFALGGQRRLGLILEVFNLLERQNVVGLDDAGSALYEPLSNVILDGYRHENPDVITRETSPVDGDQYFGFQNASSPSGVRNHGGFANSVANPEGWSLGRRFRLGVSIEF